MSKKKKGYKIIGTNGEVCPRCGQPSEIREHIAITQKHLNQPFYFSRWFNCNNAECKTTLFMLEKYKVHRRLEQREEQERINLIADQLGERPPWE